MIDDKKQPDETGRSLPKTLDLNFEGERGVAQEPQNQERAETVPEHRAPPARRSLFRQ